MLLASLTGSITHFIGDRGLYAVFALLMVDALFPAASELVMAYAGALAAGTFAGEHVVVFGTHVRDHFAAFLVVSLAGTLGYLVGSIIGWAIGLSFGRPFVERHGRLLHLKPANLARAEAWLERYGHGAVLISRLIPVVRSFVSIPAGLGRVSVLPYTVETFLGSAIWCLGFAAVGWAVGNGYRSFSRGFDYVSVAIVAVIVIGVVFLVLRRRGSHRARAGQPSR